jgi:surface polysaccharide O-acyltransferase-like enzyme
LSWADFVRAAACILVVLLHSAGPFIDIHAAWYSMPAMLESVSRCSVPLFFMLSGYLYLSTDKAVNPKLAFSKVLRGLIPLAFYTVIYLCLDWRRGYPIENPLVHPAFYHLWFLYMIPVVVLILTLIRPSNIEPIFGLSIVVALLLFCAEGFQVAFAPTGFTVIYGAAVYLLYALGGFYLWRLPALPSAGVASALVFAAAAILISIFTLAASARTGALDSRFYTYDSMLVIIESFAAGYALKAWGTTPASAAPAAFISNHSLGIYCLHPLFLDIVLRKVPMSTIGLFGAFFIAFGAASLAAMILRRVPLGRWIA